VQREAPFARLASVHARYLWSGLASEPRPALVEEVRSAYREGVRWVDDGLRDTFGVLEKAGLLKDALTIVTADHGEAFGEHGMLLHGRALYDEVLRVPLVVRGPAPFDKPRKVAASVSLTDVLPTVLDLVGLPPADDAEGTSLRPVVEQGGNGRAVEAEETRAQAQTAGESIAVLGSVRTVARKFIATYEMKTGEYREELYDLAADPGERVNLAGADGLAPDLTADEAFCRAVGRIRERLWAASARTRDAQANRELLTDLKAISRARPVSPCAPR
jgi:choline-sulfatase